MSTDTNTYTVPARFQDPAKLDVEQAANLMRKLPSRYITTLRRVANKFVRRGDDYEYYSTRGEHGVQRQCSEEVYRLEKLGFIFLERNGTVEITTVGYGYLQNMHTEKDKENDDTNE